MYYDLSEVLHINTCSMFDVILIFDRIYLIMLSQYCLWWIVLPPNSYPPQRFAPFETQRIQHPAAPSHGWVFCCNCGVWVGDVDQNWRPKLQNWRPPKIVRMSAFCRWNCCICQRWSWWQTQIWLAFRIPGQRVVSRWRIFVMNPAPY